MIAVTGVGIISPAGISRADLLRSLSETRTGIAESSSFGLPCRGITHIGEVKDFSPKAYIPAMKARRMSRFSQLALSSAVEAMKDSGFAVTEDNCCRSGVVTGTGLASTDSTDRFYGGLLCEGPEGTNPMVFPETVQNIAAAHISMHFGTRGQNITFSHADISSELALFYASELLKDRQADMVIVSGAEELSSSEIYGYANLGALSNSMHCFGRERAGFVIAEGSAALILERLEDAGKRGTEIYCTIGSVSITSAPSKNTDYDATGLSMINAMTGACNESSVKTPDCIFASANSTRHLDRLEAEAIRKVFGNKVPVTAPRAYYGYYPADGMLRTAMAALCLKHGFIPAIAGLEDRMENCSLDLVTDGPRKLRAGAAMINTFSAGGGAASVMLRNI